MTTRILIRELEGGKSIKRDFEQIAKERRLEVEVTVDEPIIDGLFDPIPVNYDVYLLHYSQVNPEEVKELRKQNKKALIYGLYDGGSLLGINERERKVTDKFYHLWGVSPKVSEKDLVEIIETVKQSLGQT